MATKTSLYHAYKILEEKKHYKIIDIYSAICYLSAQVGANNSKDTIFIIRSSHPSIYSLYKIVNARFPYINNRTTFNSTVNVLIEKGILIYNSDEKAWQIIDMECMYAKGNSEDDNSKKGFMYLYKQLLTDDFYNMSISKKRLMYLSLCLVSSKGYNKKKLLNANVLKEDSIWRKALHTSNVNYIKKIFRDFLDGTDLFIDCSSHYRKSNYIQKQSSEPYLKEPALRKIKRALNYNFHFKANTSSITRNSDENSIEYYYNLVTSCRPYYDFMMNKIKGCQKTIQDKLTRPLITALLSLTRNISWRCKILLFDKIITKLFDDKIIVSPTRFVNTLIKTVI